MRGAWYGRIYCGKRLDVSIIFHIFARIVSYEKICCLHRLHYGGGGVRDVYRVQDNEDALTTQRQRIVSYLTSSHVPQLIAEEDVENSLEPNPPFYELIDQQVYRYISTYYDAGRESRAVVGMGDEVELTYTAYIFTGSVPRTTSVYMTNDATVLAALVEEGLNAEYWSTDPMTVNLGTTSIIKGLELSLLGCREGDSVEAYMTFEAAYGSDQVGIVPVESSVLWVYTINKLVKN